jgi:tetratricopeptide (TPR) repeat protein
VLLAERGEPGAAREALAESIELWERAGNQRGQSASLHELAGIEFAQGNPTEARRLLQRSLQIDEALGDQRGQSASLHQLAIIEEAQGNPTEARRLWERSIALEETLGNVAGRAASLSMLAQLEAMEGNFEKAIRMAREAVTLLEGIGAAAAAQAKAVLEAIQAGARGEQAEGSRAAVALHERLARVRGKPPDQALAEIDARLESARQGNQPEEEVLLLLARSALCWNAGDVSGCDESLGRAEEALNRVADEEQRQELADLVATLQAQRAAAGTGRAAESVRLHGEAVEQWQADNPAGALALFEASLAASREEKNAHNVAMNLLALGQALLVLGRAQEAVARLREGLEVAAPLGDDDLLRAMRQAAAAAAQAVAMEESLQRPLAEVLAEADSDEAKAQVLLARAAALASQSPDEALSLTDQALELAQRSLRGPPPGYRSVPSPRDAGGGTGPPGRGPGATSAGLANSRRGGPVRPDGGTGPSDGAIEMKTGS